MARLDVDSSIDIWSLGCVFSEAASWVVSGIAGLQRYRFQREEETKCLRDFKDGNSFHNGERILKAVESMHINLREDIRSSDHVTDAVWNTMVEEMLDVSDRPNTRQLLKKSGRILRDAEEKLNSAMSHSSFMAPREAAPAFNRSSSFALRPRTPPERPTILEEGLTLTPHYGHNKRWISEGHIRRSPQSVPNRPARATTYDETKMVDEREENMLPKLKGGSSIHTRRHSKVLGCEPSRCGEMLCTAQQKRCVEESYDASRYGQPSVVATTPRSDRPKASSKGIASSSKSYSRPRTVTPPDVNSRHITDENSQYSHDYGPTVRNSSSSSLSSPTVRPSTTPNGGSSDIFPPIASEGKDRAVRSHYPSRQAFQHKMGVKRDIFPSIPSIEQPISQPLPFLSVADAQQQKAEKKVHGTDSWFTGSRLDVQLRSRDHVRKRFYILDLY